MQRAIHMQRTVTRSCFPVTGSLHRYVVYFLLSATRSTLYTEDTLLFKIWAGDKVFLEISIPLDTLTLSSMRTGWKGLVFPLNSGSWLHCCSHRDEHTRARCGAGANKQVMFVSKVRSVWSGAAHSCTLQPLNCHSKG